ncbi:MAG: hypothetical protein FWF63_04335 [Fibromonadales bacterium]|nr:hypothetical protein [Fibromonadales bacterium]
MNRIFSFATMFCISMFFSCTEVERDNCWDEKSVNSKRCFSEAPSSSSARVPSLSSARVSSSSSAVVPSSSSVDCVGVGSYSCDISGYRIVEIDKQTWMAENLNCDVKGSYCYDNEPANCNEYGRLYDWCTANAVCPKGWHLPTDAEWQTLVNLAGGDATAGKYLRATDDDIYDFSALPGGYGNSAGSFNNIGNYGLWWSATEASTSDAYLRSMYFHRDNVLRYFSSKHNNLFSVRCVKD